MAPTVEIITPRFALRSLTPEHASDRYLAWFRDPDAERFIETAAVTQARSDLEAYIRARCDRDDVLFLGIFDRESDLHIGNIKFEPVNSTEGSTVMGILIGDASFRGKGVTTEVLEATGGWLKEHRGIRTIMLGVSRDNQPAIRAYIKAGFKTVEPAANSRLSNALKMILNL